MQTQEMIEVTFDGKVTLCPSDESATRHLNEVFGNGDWKDTLAIAREGWTLTHSGGNSICVVRTVTLVAL